MQFKTFFTGAMASGLLLSACTTDVIPLPDEELYARQFVKDFGLTDPTHDYNMAQQSGIKVITASSTDLKVYAKVNGKSYLFADATGISGTTEIPLTLPKDVDEVSVKAGSRRFTVKLDATLDLRNVSRTIVGSETDITKQDGLEWQIVPEKVLGLRCQQSPFKIYGSVEIIFPRAIIHSIS